MAKGSSIGSYMPHHRYRYVEQKAIPLMNQCLIIIIIIVIIKFGGLGVDHNNLCTSDFTT